LLIGINRFLNLALQFINIGARFLFIFFLAKYLDATMVGFYGIFVATVSYVIYFVGMDYYIYISREIIKRPLTERAILLKGQVILSISLYLVIVPILVLFLNNSNWPGNLVWWFLPILILEHFNQEMSRLLVVLSEPLSSSLVLFIRQGIWSLVMVISMAIEPNYRNLDFVMALWATAGLSAAMFAIWRLRQLEISGWYMPVDWHSLKDGIIVSLAFLVGTVAVRGVLTFDRYWIDLLIGIDAVAAYVVLLGVASTLIILLESAIFSFSYPELIDLNHKGKYQDAQKLVNWLFLQTIVLSILFGITSWLGLPYLLNWIGNPIYNEYIDLYPWLFTAIMFNALSMVPHYALFARGIDKPIIYSHVSAIIFFFIVTWLVSKMTPNLAVPIGLNSSFIIIFVWKIYAYFSLFAKK
jgi:O-antigen/teichoic acid export membrane protein